MEKIDDKKIIEWLLGSGSGYGDGTGSGYGDGSGSGYDYDYDYGLGSGSGYGYGDGSGYGSGTGSGDGLGDGLGDGSGYGSGDGYDDGTGDGLGTGYGSGDGSGDGTGSGSGYGDGIILKKHNSNTVFIVDNMPTVILSIHGDFAKGYTIADDFSVTNCYIARDNAMGLFAHGDTLKNAYDALQEKCLEEMSEEQRIDKFLQVFEKDTKYSGKTFYEWHHILTSSCEFGRKEFFKQVGATFDDLFTVDEFIKLTENAYGGRTIKLLKQRWETK